MKTRGIGELGDKLNEICTATKKHAQGCKNPPGHPVHHPERDCWPAILFGI